MISWFVPVTNVMISLHVLLDLDLRVIHDVD